MSHIKCVVYWWIGLVKTHLAMYSGQKNILYRGRNSADILIIVIVVPVWCHWAGASSWCCVTTIAKNTNCQSGSLRALKSGKKQMDDSSSTVRLWLFIPPYILDFWRDWCRNLSPHRNSRRPGGPIPYRRTPSTRPAPPKRSQPANTHISRNQ